MKQILCILLICLTLVLIIGCKVAVEREAPSTSAAADVTEVEEGLSEVDELDEELDLSEFDELEKELDEIDW